MFLVKGFMEGICNMLVKRMDGWMDVKTKIDVQIQKHKKTF